MLVQYLKSNPAAAKAAYDQAQMMLKTPGMANAFTNMMVGATSELVYGPVAHEAAASSKLAIYLFAPPSAIRLLCAI